MSPVRGTHIDFGLSVVGVVVVVGVCHTFGVNKITRERIELGRSSFACSFLARMARFFSEMGDLDLIFKVTEAQNMATHKAQYLETE